MWCAHDIGQEAVEARYEEMMAGSNRQPCEVCGKRVKAEYSFCHVCGRVLCGEHMKAHLTSAVPVSERRDRYRELGGPLEESQGEGRGG